MCSITKKGSEYEGYHPFYSTDCNEAYGSFEVYYDYLSNQPGWYWASGWPGCLHDGEPQGPFATSTAAYLNAQGDYT